MIRRRQAEDNTESGFLGRWSKRKARSDQGHPDGEADNGDVSAGVRDTDGVVPAPEEGRAPDSGVDMPGETREEEEEPVKTDADMPDLESIDDSTNMSEFFSPGVSEQLRNQALRRLFHMSKFNVVDPLDDYNESFRDFELLGDLVTSDMRHRLEMDEQQRREAEIESHGETPETVADARGEHDDKTTEAGSDPADHDPEVQDDDQDHDQDDDTVSERFAADSRRGEVPAADGNASGGDGDVTPRNKT